MQFAASRQDQATPYTRIGRQIYYPYFNLVWSHRISPLPANDPQPKQLTGSPSAHLKLEVHTRVVPGYVLPIT
jgi:hypothetical protein